MGLQSRLFRGDPKLEAAAVSVSAHVTPGATGDHVAKIQFALMRLDEAPLDQDGTYGPQTAAAVLAYKQKRNIINRSYQTQADNIVGIMTMAALDKEMRQREQTPTTAEIIVCRVGRTPPRSQATGGRTTGRANRRGPAARRSRGRTRTSPKLRWWPRSTS